MRWRGDADHVRPRALDATAPPARDARQHFAVPGWLLAVGPLLLGAAAYFGTWNGGLFFDDLPSVRDNVAMQQGSWWGAAFGDPYSPVSNRPVSCLLLALDRALFGPSAAGHRVTNLLLHLAAVALVAAVVRALLQARNLAARFDAGRARMIAAMAAALFAVHPLGVDAVAYVTQRSTLAMAVAWLAALYAVLRAERSPARAVAWRAAAIGGIALGMACKEELAAAPLLLPLFLRAFAVPRWRELRAHLPLLVAAAVVGWAVLLACVLGGPANPTVGYQTTPRATAFEWLATQAGIVVHYLRLVLWPGGLRGCYDWPIVRALGPALAPGLVVVALLAGAFVACWRRPAWGFAGA